MSQAIHNVNLGLALFIGHDQQLAAAVKNSISNKYQLEISYDIPAVWSKEVDVVLLEYVGDDTKTLKEISEILSISNGVQITLLLKEKSFDFVIKASHYGVQSYINCPDDLPQLLSIMHMQSRRKIGKQGIVTSFFSLKGGVGVTSLATNVASHISDLTEKKTVILDLNVPLGDTTLYLNMDNRRLYSVVDYILNIDRFDDALVYKSLDMHESGLYVLALPSDLTELDNLNGASIKGMIESLSKFFDHVIIDCASNLSEINLSCLDMSDNIVVVSEPTLSSLRAANKALDVGQKLGYDLDSLMLLINRSQETLNIGMKEVINSLDFRTVRYVNNDYVLFNQSMNLGKLIKQVEPNSKVNNQIEAIANQLHFGSISVEKPAEEQQPIQPKKKGFLGFFKRSSKTSNK